MKLDPVIAAAMRFLTRSEPGAGGRDDGVPASTHVRIKSIPHLSTERLERRAAWLSEHLHDPKLLREFDHPRRTLIHWGVHRLAIEHELKLRKQYDEIAGAQGTQSADSEISSS